MKIFALLFVLLMMAGCASVNTEVAKAYISTEETVGVEWADMNHNAYRVNHEGIYELWVADDRDSTRKEKLDRRDRKSKTMKMLSDRLKKELE